MDPYAVLKVRRTANLAKVKAHYRKEARRRHPDCGGSVEAFQELELAYAVLIDPVRRKRYDETGQCEETDADRSKSQVLEMMVHAWQAVVQVQMSTGAYSPANHDLVRLMREHLTNRLLGLAKSRAKILAPRKIFAEMKSRFEDPDDLIEAQIDRELAKIDANVAGLDREVDITQRTVEYLSLCKYKSNAPYSGQNVAPTPKVSYRTFRELTGL